MRVFITGATGLIGRRLLPALRDRGDVVVALTRKSPKHSLAADETVVGDPTTAGPWLDKLLACDAVVHLAGAGVFDHRWSKAFMQEIRDSRVNSTRTIAEALAKRGHAVRTFVSGSAVGFYGNDRGDEVLTEESHSGTGFLADVTIAWEAAADPARATVRVCHPRTGIVLDRAGGVLPNLARPFKLFVGGRVGSGRQYTPWIHHADMLGLLRFALDTPALVGPFNACSPNPATNATVSATLAKVLGRPNWLPVPRLAIRVLLGKVAEVATGSLRAVPMMATTHGYRFQFPELEPALRDLYSA